MEHITVSSSEIIKLGNTQPAPEIDSLFGALVIGVIGGLLGAIFIRVNNRINAVRKRILKTKNRKIVEGLFITFLTVTCMYMAITFNYWGAGGKENYQNNENFCQTYNFNTSNNITMPTRRFLCNEVEIDGHKFEKFDRLATLLFESQANTIKTFMSNQRTILLKNAGIFLMIWYTFTCLTSGTVVPAGIFLPCILIGCALG